MGAVKVYLSFDLENKSGESSLEESNFEKVLN